MLAAVTAALAVTGCVSMPSAGPVLSYPVSQQTGGQNGQNLQFSAQPPGAGWNPQQIVSGFLIAAAANQDQVAREYLAPAERKRWNPSLTTTTYVYKSRPNVLNPVPQPTVPQPGPARSGKKGRGHAAVGDRRGHWQDSGDPVRPRTEPTRSLRRPGRTAPARSTSPW